MYLLLGFRYDEHAKTFNAPKLLSGLAPPASYSWVHPNRLPSLICARPWNARETLTGKPINIDFTGYGCVNCRKMEQFVWSAPGVEKTIEGGVHPRFPHVDDREKLPKEEQHRYTTSNSNPKDIITIGDRWATLEAETFHKVSQPLVCPHQC